MNWPEVLQVYLPPKEIRDSSSSPGPSYLYQSGRVCPSPGDRHEREMEEKHYSTELVRNERLASVLDWHIVVLVED